MRAVARRAWDSTGRNATHTVIRELARASWDQAWSAEHDATQTIAAVSCFSVVIILEKWDGLPFSFFVFASQMQLQASPVSAIVMSRNASTSVCLKFRENSKDIFLVLDFAPAPPERGHNHGTPLAMVISTSLEQTAARLSGILPMDNHLMTRDKQWQAQLFTSCTVCMFTPVEGDALSSEVESAAIKESVALLRIMEKVDDRGRDWERATTTRERDRNGGQSDQPSGSNHGKVWERTPFDVGRAAEMSGWRASRVGGGSLGEGSSARVAEQPPKTTFMPYEQTKRHCRIFFPDDESLPPTSPTPSPISLSYEASASGEEADFECVICFENIPEEEGIRLVPCAHGFCRDCLAGHVCSKIEERKFPVFCPLCMTEQRNANPSGKQQPDPIATQTLMETNSRVRRDGSTTRGIRGTAYDMVRA